MTLAPPTAPAVRDVLARRAVVPLFQPIVGLRDGIPVGYEALTRPADRAFGGPLELFEAAEREGCRPALERLCWRVALEAATDAFRRRAGWSNLFMNVLPDVLLESDFLPFVESITAEVGLEPGQIVVELTEGSRITDYERCRTLLARYREAGFRIAVDDAGAGHSSLQTIAELRPDFVKVDRDLVARLEQHAGRRAVMEAMVVLTRRLGIGLIAEGVETVEEMRELRRLGVACAQGFWVGRPAPADQMQDVHRAVVEELQPVAADGGVPRAHHAERSFIGDIAEPGPTVPAGTPAVAAHDVFRHTPGDALVLLDGERPVGLVMRAHLDARLAERFGREIWLRQPIDALMDRRPLVVDARLSLEAAARLVTERAPDAVYDRVVVTRDGAYVGTVAVHRLLEAITSLKVASARLENPLTGLPGGVAIQRAYEARAGRGEPVAMVYLDLDHFKAFNDRYGFHHGDRAIRLLAQLAADLATRLAGPPAELFHVGGDDFIVVATPEQAHALAADVGALLPELVLPLYSAQDRAAGWIEATSREGARRRYPLVTVTTAVLELDGERATDYATALAALAEAKAAGKARVPPPLPSD